MILAGPPRSHENRAATEAIFTPVPRKDEFCEVHGSKRFLYVPAKPLTTGSATPFVVKTPQLGTIRCSVVYQGVATRNGATTQEMLAHRTGVQVNFALTEFSEVHTIPIGSQPVLRISRQSGPTTTSGLGGCTNNLI